MGVPAGIALFAVDGPPAAGRFVLDGPEGRHAATVRRSRVGEVLAVTDGAGSWAAGPVVVTARDAVTLDLGDPVTDPPPRPRVTVVQALPKGERSELAVDLATEAGADVIVPWSASRCVARWVGDKAGRGVQRWRQVAREAAKQSRRTRFPTVDDLHDSRALAARITALTVAGGTALLLHEAESNPLSELDLTTVGELMIVVGPEGGLSPEEIATFTTAGAVAVRLGPEVLRTSTAAAVALGAIGVSTGRWR
ncbi:16S rRNA (uracil(1498)-N(3))-methyltransferase [Nakamurella deserti]|uniref:16S rRNA (uracil(1498)-N(3))-methyltransferase n=1 Tax=Nakamurella deserti TaxID=2164074 RepID=UPI001F0BEBA3|nr:16S rRNA (uracil(1498)-N(3))-methyltransferase [Nakamurella deserti]